MSERGGVCSSASISLTYHRTAIDSVPVKLKSCLLGVDSSSSQPHFWPGSTSPQHMSVTTPLKLWKKDSVYFCRCHSRRQQWSLRIASRACWESEYPTRPAVSQRRHDLTSTGHRQLHRLRFRLRSSVLTRNHCPSATRQHTGADPQDLAMIVSLNWPPATVEGNCDLRWHTLQRCLVGKM